MVYCILLSDYRSHKKTVNFRATLANTIVILGKIRHCPGITTVQLSEELVIKRRGIFMGYHENIAACKTEKELLELWKTKEPVTKNYYEHNTELFNSIAVVNLKKGSGKPSSNYGEIEAYALADKEEIKKQLEIIAPDIIICGATFGALNHVYDGKIRPEGLWCDNWFYYTDIISDNKTLVIDYYHPANYYPALVNYYAVTNIYQQALFKPY